MLTKKRLRRAANVAFLVGAIGCMIAVCVIGKLSLGEKAVLVAGYAAALKAVLPTLNKEVVEAIDSSDLPESEPSQDVAK
jgi:hypothetical protein